MLREIKDVIENKENQNWANRFKQQLLDMKRIKDTAIKIDKNGLDKQSLESIYIEYDINNECS